MIFIKDIICKMCGSNKLVKKGNTYVCQSCGTQFYIEKSDNPVQESRIDEKSIKLGIEYYNKWEYSKADYFLKKAIEENPNDYEAIFYEGLNSAMQSTIENFHLDDMIIAAERAIKLVPENKKYDRSEEFREVLIEKLIGFWEWYKSNQLNNPSEQDLIKLFRILPEFIKLSDKILDAFPPEFNTPINLYNYTVNWCRILQTNQTYYNKSNLAPIGQLSADMSTINFAKEKENEYNLKIEKFKNFSKHLKNEGCYIATSIYGSYDCPEVWTLRRFRDDVLKNSIQGKLFIHLYYSVSPSLVKYFGENKLFKKFFKPLLDKFVVKLQGEGVESSYYIDK